MGQPLSQRPVIEYTVCGLRVDDRFPLDWNAGSFLAAAQDADGAISFVENAVTGQMTMDGTQICTGFALGAVHPDGEHPRLGEIESAFVKINPNFINWALDNEDAQEYRVFGITRDTWQSVVLDVVSNGPDMAYYVAYQRCLHVHGQELLYVCTHLPDTPWVDEYPYADPLSTSEEEMRVALEKWGVA